MESNEEQNYKLLNAQLVTEVRNHRTEISEYKKQVIALNSEILVLRKGLILQRERQREDHIGIIRTLMQRLNIDADCLGDRTEEREERTSPVVVNRRRQHRLSSWEIFERKRQARALVCSTMTIAPPNRRDFNVEVHEEAPERGPELSVTQPPTLSEQREEAQPSEPEEREIYRTNTPPPTHLDIDAEEDQASEGEERQIYGTVEESGRMVSEEATNSPPPTHSEQTTEEDQPSEGGVPWHSGESSVRTVEESGRAEVPSDTDVSFVDVCNISSPTCNNMLQSLRADVSACRSPVQSLPSGSSNSIPVTEEAEEWSQARLRPRKGREREAEAAVLPKRKV